MSFTGQRDTDLLIMEKLDDYDLFKFCTTNRYTRELCQNEMFWRNRLRSKFGEDALKFKYPDRKWRNYYLNIIYALGMGASKGTNADDKDKAKLGIYYAREYPDVVDFLFNKYIKDSILYNSFNDQIVFLNKPLIQFLQNADLGGIKGPNGGLKVQTLLAPYLKDGFLTRSILMILFNIHSRVNNLRFKQDGKIYFKIDSDMKKYLAPYLENLEARGNFDSNKFPFNRYQSFLMLGTTPTQKLNENQKNIVKNKHITEKLTILGIILQGVMKTWDSEYNL